jgi:hypothetical protein
VVPYTGATQAVDLGAYNLTVNGVSVGTGSGVNASSNAAIGNDALSQNTTGVINTALGLRALSKNTIGSYNTATGAGALSNNIDGNYNTANGMDALTHNMTGWNNTANGERALFNNTTGGNNTATGNNALSGNTTGTGNIAVGYEALSNNIGGTFNTAVGYGANVVSGSGDLINSTAIGWGAQVAASHTIQLGNTSVTKVNTSGTITAAGFSSTVATGIAPLVVTSTTPVANLSIGGNAATATTASTVTTNANLTGPVTSVGNATTITDGAVTTAKVANANVTLAKLENLASGAIIVGNSSNRPTAVSISGDAVLSPTGELIIAIGAVTTSKIANSAVITASIADGAITNAKVTDVAASKITGTFTSATVNGKVIVGASSAASASAVLEASSTTQGFLPPRMTSAQRVAISTPVAGLVVWCSDCGSNGELQVYNGTTWKNMIGGTASTPLITVGNAYQGGIIAYILVSGDPGYDATTPHGLIAATSDQSTGIQWYNGSYFIIGSTGTAIGTGSSNTTDIIVSQLNTGSYAAKLCRDFRGGGYTDWYLPSMVELNKLILNKTAIVGGFDDHNFYWSSSENPYGAAWSLRFYDGWQSDVSKSTSLYVRAVRSF